MNVAPADKVGVSKLLKKFIATDSALFLRCDDSSGVIQNVYGEAIALWHTCVVAQSDDEIFKDLYDLLVWIYDALDRMEDVVHTYKLWYQETGNVSVLMAYLSRLKDPEPEKRRVLETASTLSVSKALELYMALDAHSYCIEHILSLSGTLEGESLYDHLIKKVITWIAPSSPEVATLLYRALVAQILKEAKSAHYPTAVKYLQKMLKLSLTTPSTIPAHDLYLKTLLAQHKLKRKFLELIDKNISKTV